ncbi:hypothetical protein N7510_004859 [Penicillium lagena]|uniref:uncharacterized protein n=1 Tax=Penicillium lagena TaxID=94218 RepID=UPI002541DF68|nr:uncharacterized protein N7510_004859 [Penicillium lagena]KAJ5620875.1 hypothetical protein N7510_004859 [Penicillium lagena]
MLGVGLKGSATAASARQRVVATYRSTRSISSFRPQGLRTSGLRSQLTPATSRNVPWRVAAVAAGPAAVRFNSTSSDAVTDKIPEGTAPPSSPDVSNLWETDITSIPERVGYLKELGLDYGWGPSSIMQWMIEHIHLWTGLPWWASIVSTGLLVRLALLKPMLDASDTAARVHNVKPILNPLKNEMMRAGSEGRQMDMHMKRAEIKRIQAEHGIVPYKSFIPMLQIPLAYGCFRVIRGMTSLPVPGLANESVGWLTDLTVSDPTFILPAATSAMMFLTFKRGGDTGTMDIMSTGPGKAMMYGLPGISLVFMSFFPSALQLYFVATGAFAFCQARIMTNKTFRTHMKMAITKNHKASDVEDIEVLQHSKGLQLLQQRLAQEKAQAAGPTKPELETSDKKTSAIDGWVNNFKGYQQKMGQQMKDGIREFQGKAPATNADGSKAPAPRLSENTRKRAEDYERTQREQDDAERDQRNLERQQAHQRYLDQQKEKAKKGLDQQIKQAAAKKSKRNGRGKRS